MSRAVTKPVTWPRLRLLVVCTCVVTGLHAESFEARVDALFRPSPGEMIALSPDGQRIAYTTHEGGDLAIAIVNIENSSRKRIVPVEQPARDPTAPEIKPATRLRFLRWATPDRLIYAPAERVVPLPSVTDKTGRVLPNPDGPTIVAPILAVDADGRQHGALVDARDFQETPAEARRSLADLLRTPAELAAARNEPIHWRMPHVEVRGFLPHDRNQLIVATHGAYSMPVNHVVDIRDGNRRELGDDWPAPADEPQVFDWFRHQVVGERKDGARPLTLWRDEDLSRVQQELTVKFPRRIVEILDWTDTHSRVLFRVTGGNDPGRVFVYERLEDLAVEVLQLAPGLATAKLNPTRWFEFETADRAHLSGYLTRPLKVAAEPPPLLVIFLSGERGQFQPSFDPEAQVLADLGFAVMRLNHRSVADGRAAAAAAQADSDHVAVSDAQAAIEWLAAQSPGRPFDRQRVAALGRSASGPLALRARELEPAVFACGLVIDPPAASRATAYQKMAEDLNRRLNREAGPSVARQETP